MIQQYYFKEEIDVGHSLGLKGLQMIASIWPACWDFDFSLGLKTYNLNRIPSETYNKEGQFSLYLLPLLLSGAPQPDLLAVWLDLCLLEDHCSPLVMFCYYSAVKDALVETWFWQMNLSTSPQTAAEMNLGMMQHCH